MFQRKNIQISNPMEDSPLDMDGEIIVPAYDFEKIIQEALDGKEYQLPAQQQKRQIEKAGAQKFDERKKQLLDRRKNYDPRRSAQNDVTSRERIDGRSKSNIRKSEKSPIQQRQIQLEDKKPLQNASLLRLGNIVSELK